MQIQNESNVTTNKQLVPNSSASLSSDEEN